MRKTSIAILMLAAGVTVARLIRPERTNSPVAFGASLEAVVKPPQEAVAVLDRSCSGCHSNRTLWSWYSGIAPVSWPVASDVKEGRARLNFSLWNIYSPLCGLQGI